jgi:endonuclease-3
MNPAKRRQIYERLRAANPDPKSELAYRTPFELLVAVVLSAQATDKGVNKATARLFPVTNTPAAFVKLGVDGLIPYINSIGLFNTKAKNLIALSQFSSSVMAARCRTTGPRSRRCRASAGRRPTWC